MTKSPKSKPSTKAAQSSKSAKSSKAKQAKKANKAQQGQSSLARKVASVSFKLILIGLAFLTLYTIYLDAKVRAKFEGQRWQVPVQVFGQVERFSAGSRIDLSLLASSLKTSGYQKVANAIRPGQFALSGKRIIVYRHAFESEIGMEQQALVTIDVQQGSITQVYQDNEVVKQVALAPALLARIVPESKEDRVIVDLVNVPEKLLDTLLLVEDREFYFHAGVSPLGIIRALYKNLSAGRTVQGGSTLTQQLVKNMYLTREKTLVRKVNEAIMALLLEYRYSKDQLLEAYINEVYLGQHYANGVYGFGLAADFYFGRSLDQLTPAQMALLIGQIKGPSYYDPWRHPERASKRRNLVLRLMFEQHLIDRSAFEYAVESPLSIRKQRRLVTQQHHSYLALVKQELKEKLEGVDPSSGIRVFTGFSALAQQQANETVAKQLSALEQQHQQTDLQAAMLVTDIASGEIRAIVGDRQQGYAGFNRALHAKRPIGSLIKPAVYLPALERYQQFNFATPLADEPIVLASGGGNGSEWRPKNYDGKFRGKVPLLDGLTHSYNVPTVNLGMSLGLDTVAESLAMLGYQEQVTLRPSLLLGAISMSPYQINQLYLPIANQGRYQQAHAITKIIDLNGVTVWQYQSQQEQRISDNAAYLLNYALEQVTETGTAKSLTWRLPEHARVAGKTGTSNDLRDSWFIGYDAKQLVTTWVGNDDNKATKLTGSSGALVLFSDYIKHTGIESLNTSMPEQVAMTMFEQTTGNAVKQACQQTSEYPAIVLGIKYQNCQHLAEDKRSWLEKLFGD